MCVCNENIIPPLFLKRSAIIVLVSITRRRVRSSNVKCRIYRRSVYYIACRITRAAINIRSWLLSIRPAPRALSTRPSLVWQSRRFGKLEILRGSDSFQAGCLCTNESAFKLTRIAIERERGQANDSRRDAVIRAIPALGHASVSMCA